MSRVADPFSPLGGTTPVCTSCGFAGSGQAAALVRTARQVAVRFERCGLGSLATERADSVAQLVLDDVITVRDATHRAVSRLRQLSIFQNLVFTDTDPEPIQPVALDFAWGAVVGLVANLEALAGVIDTFPGDCWARVAQCEGQPASALELANQAVHRAYHHVTDLERLAASGDAYS